MSNVSMTGADLLPEQGENSKRNNVGIAPAGTHLARVYGLIYAGECLSEYQGQEKTSRPMRLMFELVNEKAVFYEGEEARPFGLNYEINYSRHEKSKMATVVAPWLGIKFSEEWINGFNIFSLVGQYALVTVSHKEKKKKPGEFFAEIVTITSPIKGMPLTEGYNENFAYYVRDHGTWSEQWLRIPQWLRKDLLDGPYKTYTDFKQIQEAGCVIWDGDDKPEGKKMERSEFTSALIWKNRPKLQAATAAEPAKVEELQAAASAPESDFGDNHADLDDPTDDLPF